MEPLRTFLIATRYISNIEMAGAKVKYVPLNPPASGKSTTTSAGEWSFNREELESAIGPRTKMIVRTHSF
jgi:kynurenine aminotransferase